MAVTFRLWLHVERHDDAYGTDEQDEETRNEYEDCGMPDFIGPEQDEDDARTLAREILEQFDPLALEQSDNRLIFA